MSRRKLVLVAVTFSILGLGLGAAGMFFLSSSVLTYANNAGNLADATVDVSLLERLDEEKIAAAREILEIRLKGSLLALRADLESLSRAQLDSLRKIEARSARFVDKD